MTEPVLLVYIAVCGLFVGNELGTAVVVHPSLGHLDARANMAAERAVYRGEARWVPFLMTGSMVLAFASAGATSGSSSTLCLIAGICLAVVIAITLIGNMPLNLRVMGADENTDFEAWRGWRRRWDQLHYLRVVLDLSALALGVWAAAV